MRIGLGTGSSRDLGQASKVPAMPAGTTGTPARDTRTAMPDLSEASLPSRLRVPSGKSETIPPLRNRRRVSFIPDAPIPARWMGNAPTDRSKNPRTGTNRVDRATKLSGRRNGIPSRKTSRKLRWLATRRTAPVAGMLCRPEARQPPRAANSVANMYCANRYQTSSPHRRSAPVPAPSLRGRQGARSALPAGAGEVWEATGSLTAEEAPENGTETREMHLEGQIVTGPPR